MFLYPSFFWDNTSVATILGYLLLFTSFYLEFANKSQINIKAYLLVFIFYFLIYVNIVGDPINNRYITTPIVTSVIFLVFSYRTVYKSFVLFTEVFGLFLTLSLLFYILKLAGVYSPDLLAQVAPDGREYSSYFLNTMLLETQQAAVYISTGFYRFYGFLNEPGFIGTLSALIILAWRFDFSNKKILYIYLVACLLSLSLASYLTLFLGFLYFISFKRVLYLLGLILLFLVVNYDLVDRYVFSRLTIIDGEFAGDNRTSSQFDIQWERLISSRDVIFGKGKGQHTLTSQHGGVSSWKTIVYNSGVVGLVLYLSIFICIFLLVNNGKFKKYHFVFLFVFLLTIYHRPNIHNIYYLIILLGGLLHNVSLKNSKIIPY